MKNSIFTFILLLTGISEGHAQFWAKSNGRFGIGDENAFAKLQVNGTASFSNPSLAILDSSATNTVGGILQFRSINWDDNHFNIQAKIGEYAFGQDSRLDFFFRENLIMSIEGGSSADRQLVYNPRDGIFRTGYLNPGSRGEYSVAMGYNSLASGYGSVALGAAAQATGESASAIGGSTAEGSYAAAFGYDNLAFGPFSFAGGKQSSAMELNAVAIGDSAVASGVSSHAIGYKTLASAHSSTATGHLTDATGLYSFAGGFATQATNTSSTAFGFVSQATGVSASSFGYATLAAGENSVAFNSVTKALGHNSLTAGWETKTTGWGSSAFGDHTTARSYASAVFGAYNDTIATSDPNAWVALDPLMMVGNGLSNDDRNNAFTIYKNGNLLAKNPTLVTSPEVVPVPEEGAGTRMMWLAEKGAFRVGGVEGDEWNADSIGTYSFASGKNTRATNFFSTATGFGTRAWGNGSTAMGYYSTGVGTASVGIGWNSWGIGYAAVALGFVNTASGDYSTAIGHHTMSNGNYSTALGYYTLSNGKYSTAIGYYTKAKSSFSAVFGRYNDEIESSDQDSWVSTDPLFIVGNGINEATRHNAFTLYKNGNLLAKHPTVVTSDPGDVTLPASGAGTRMMWLPVKSAFRVGTVEANEWDTDSIGAWSFASGFNTIASGGKSTAMGAETNAFGYASTAIGFGALSNENYTIALGYYPYAYGVRAISIGSGTEARAFQSVVIGSYNAFDGSSSPSSWISTDPLLVVGNGEHELAKSTAVIVYKNGNTDFNGYTRLGKETESAPRIKMKELPVTLTGVSYNSSISIPHGLTASKILSVSVLVEWDTDLYAPPEYSPSLNLRYNYYVNSTSIVLQNNTPSGDCLICEKVAKVTITYKE